MLMHMCVVTGEGGVPVCFPEVLGTRGSLHCALYEAYFVGVLFVVGFEVPVFLIYLPAAGVRFGDFPFWHF